MIELILMAAGTAVMANRPAVDPDCKPRIILSSVSEVLRDAPPAKRERQRTQPQQPSRGTRPCMILTHV